MIVAAFTVDNVLDADSKASIKYKITQEGLSRYNSVFSEIESGINTDPYQDEQTAQKKFNRKILIACIIGFIVIITALIVYIASTG